MDELPSLQEQSLDGDALVNFSGLSARLSPEEEYEQIIRFHAHIIVKDEIHHTDLPEYLI